MTPIFPRTASILAGGDGATVPPLDEKSVAEATEQFLASLGPEGQDRFERIGQRQEELSADDRCWLARTMFGSIATLVEPHASVWARVLTTMAISTDDSTNPKQTQKVAPQ